MRLFYFFLVVLFSFSATSCVTTVRATPAKVVVVKKLPKTHKVVSIKGHRYYKWNGKHYRKTNRGYVIVRL
ncbi:MAG: hypothetical protein GQ540_11725 [Lutibacter sp.]|uniref:DUF6515 family protein n=1 Tax=Lutibacter sp. TaxID=1925666 RepID=UPI001A0ACED1|nr:DUF6515 family protein [Lutibacter sp.]NOR29186.1 hypothetical protein [Lutibacter sp.]